MPQQALWPAEDPDGWRVCQLAGIELPGIAHVAVKVGDKLDVKDPVGAHGSTVTFQGKKAARLTITLRMHDPDQFIDWQVVHRKLRPAIGKGKKQKPVTIVHPKAQAYDIASIHIEDIDDDAGDEGFTGLYEVKISAVEHMPPRSPATTTAKKSLKAQDNALTGSSAAAPTKPSATGNRP